MRVAGDRGGPVRGDRATEFSEYVGARRSTLRRFAYLVSGDWYAAEDLVQIALAKLYLAWPKIHTEGAEDAYVRRTIVRAHIDELRRPWRRERTGIDRLDVAAPEPLTMEDRDELLAALAQLPPGQRATVVLRYWWGLSVAETARDLGCSVGTVKSQTSRAIVQLRAVLSSPDNAPR